MSKKQPVGSPVPECLLLPVPGLAYGVLDEFLGCAPRRDDPADARAWGLHLTAAGRRSLKQLELRLCAHDQALLLALNERGAGLKADLERLARVATAAAQPLPETSQRRQR